MEEVKQSTKLVVDEVVKPEEPKVVEPKVDKAKSDAAPVEDNMDVDAPEDFVMVEGGGEADVLAQEKTAPAVKESERAAVEKEEGDGAGAQPSIGNVAASTTAPATAVPGTQPGQCQC